MHSLKKESFVEKFMRTTYPNVRIMGSRIMTRKGKQVILLRGKQGDKTLRFVYGEDYVEPLLISTSQRKRVGRGQTLAST